MTIQDRLNIAQLIRAGMTNDKIRKLFPRVKKGTLAAIKAHVTRGNMR